MKQEQVIYGEKAVASFLQYRLAEVKRLFFTAKVAKRYGEICRQLARAKKIYRQVTEVELKKICASEHHGGIAIVIEPAVVPLLQPADLQPGGIFFGKPIVLLDRVANPHNVGAIVRSAVFFGIECFLLPFPMTLIPAAAWRVAAGAMTHAMVRRSQALPQAIVKLAKTHQLIAAVSHQGKPLAQAMALLKKDRPFVLLLGNEEDGLSVELQKLCDIAVTLTGTGKVESLNVSQAATILLHAFVVGEREVPCGSKS